MKPFKGLIQKAYDSGKIIGAAADKADLAYDPEGAWELECSDEVHSSTMKEIKAAFIEGYKAGWKR